MNSQERKFPFSHVAGFLLGITLTVSAVLIVFRTDWANSTKMLTIGSFAFVQVAIQFFMFMHMSEGKDRNPKVVHTIYAIGMAVIIIVGSIWVLTAGHSIH